MATAYGSHNPDAPMPLCMEPMKTHPLQHYLEEDMIQRFGFEDDFTSGSFTLYNPDGSVVVLAEPKPKEKREGDPRFRKTVVVHVDSDEE